jgi:hypothetical protein
MPYARFSLSVCGRNGKIIAGEELIAISSSLSCFKINFIRSPAIIAEEGAEKKSIKEAHMRVTMVM